MLEDVSLPVINVPKQPITGANNGYKLPVAVASAVAITAIIPELSIIVDNPHEADNRNECFLQLLHGIPKNDEQIFFTLAPESIHR